MVDMKKLLAACVVSGIVGTLFGIWSVSANRGFMVAAQDRTQQPAPLPPRAGSAATNFAPPQLEPPLGPIAGQPSLEDFTPEERVNIQVYEHTNRSVVHITTKVASPDMFFSLEGPTDGSGSGSVLDKEGHILTNHHVIEDATEIHVTLFDGQSYDAGLIGRDPTSDIAVLRITAPQEALFPIQFGDSSLLRVGQKVLAIGNPFGLERTLTVGTLSSLNRRISSKTPMKSMIQIDAALNRGNSGGPLLDTRGRMIGMNTAILSPTGQNIGVGFALPVNTIRRVVPQLIEHGRVIRPITGIASVYETDNGLVIIELTPRGPAELAGLRGFRWVRKREKRGPFYVESRQLDRSYADTIIAVDGRAVTSGEALQDLIETKQPGERVVFTVVREAKQIDVPIVLGASE
jgi:S1-C subfamily serine protease